MKWFVGLGNPGRTYANNRHNVGFMVLDLFARQWNIDWKPNARCKSIIGEGFVKGTKVVLIKPQTYMNLSGEAVRAYMDYYKAPIEDLTVIYDDMDTPLGSLRLRYKGSAGGHNGIKSIIAHLGTQSFQRIRVGISRPEPGREIVDYVLEDFRKHELPALEQMLEKAAEAMAFSLEHTFEQTMAKFNG